MEVGIASAEHGYRSMTCLEGMAMRKSVVGIAVAVADENHTD